MRRFLLTLLVLAYPTLARAADLTDATGRTVHVPDHVAHILPAGPPAAVLLAVLAPDLMVGWPHAPSSSARALLDEHAAGLPASPSVTGKEGADADAIKEAAPDLILDYGDVGPRYVAMAQTTQKQTGIPTALLDGKLTAIPQVLRSLGAVLHRQDRAETLARLAETMLELPQATTADTPSQHPKVVYAHGSDGLSVAAPGTGATEVFAMLGWEVAAPPGEGRFRQATFDQVRALDPDVLVFSDPAMRKQIAAEPWRSMRAVHEHHAFIAPHEPFGWIEEPPSINRLLGLAWLGGADAASIGASFNAIAYGRVLSRVQIESLRETTRPIEP
jgi:iron complex transport system substrate-binding protein